MAAIGVRGEGGKGSVCERKQGVDGEEENDTRVTSPIKVFRRSCARSQLGRSVWRSLYCCCCCWCWQCSCCCFGVCFLLRGKGNGRNIFGIRLFSPTLAHWSKLVNRCPPLPPGSSFRGARLRPVTLGDKRRDGKEGWRKCATTTTCLHWSKSTRYIRNSTSGKREEGRKKKKKKGPAR